MVRDAVDELYPEVVDGPEDEGGVPSRLLKDRPPQGGEGRYAMEDVRRLPVREDNEIAVALDELAREGARRMIAAALRAEADEYVAAFASEVDEEGKRLVVRNGRVRERRVTVGSGTVAIRAPRVNDKRVDEEAASASGSARRSCPLTPGARRRSTMCCRCSGVNPAWWTL